MFTITLYLFSSFIHSNVLKAQTKDNLYKEIALPHKAISYKEATDSLFKLVENRQGVVCSFYSPNECLKTDINPGAKIMNVEHTWPQSIGANGVAKSDLHHLFATSSSTNSMRSSLPFCDVIEIKWSNQFSKRGYSSFGEHCFEPPANHKGDVARALFYFSVRYRLEIDPNQETYLRQWHVVDPVDQKELERNKIIMKLQNNSNPFIVRPELVDEIYDF